MAVVRLVRAGEAAALRDLRLRALADSPNAFGSTHEAESAMPLKRWQERAREGAKAEVKATFVAEADGGALVGLATGTVEDEEPGHASLISMWVDPAHRGRGIGTELVEAVAGWARSRSIDTLLLWVVRANAPAVSLYLDCGFEAAGPEQPLPHSPDLTEILMFRALDQTANS